jgi:3',5'-cyclic AMP phosphodiesterase CpdA
MPPPLDDSVAFVQISDVHIGTSLMPSSSDFHRWLPGYNPHDSRLLLPLEQALKDARSLAGLEPAEALHVVLSGDLTQSGLDNDYATAMALLHNRFQWTFGPRPRWLGLGLPRDRTFSVPGNHDHWRRKKFANAFSRELAQNWFDATPWKRWIDGAGGLLRLELYGVDSNSGFYDPDDLPTSNFGAGGEICPQEFEQLEKQLRESPQAHERSPLSVVRAFVCHHGFSKDGGILDANPLGEWSRQRLVELATQHRVAVALTGHTHGFHVQDWRSAPGADPVGVLRELRCATTLQWTKGSPSLQGFWMHRIARRGGSGECEWTSWKYQFAGKDFYVDHPISFRVPAVQTPPTA